MPLNPEKCGFHLIFSDVGILGATPEVAGSRNLLKAYNLHRLISARRPIEEGVTNSHT